MCESTIAADSSTKKKKTKAITPSWDTKSGCGNTSACAHRNSNTQIQPTIRTNIKNIENIKIAAQQQQH